jgi:ABC-type lipoprotein release transport system permease subunit
LAGVGSLEGVILGAIIHKQINSLINFFNSFTQAMGKLLSKQQVGRAVKPIQDSATRLWSTYTMVERLI